MRKKHIVFCIMLLCIGTCVIPSITGDDLTNDQQNTTTPLPYEGPDLLSLFSRHPSQTHHPIIQTYTAPQPGTTLITETFNSRVMEIDMNGTILWQEDGLYLPVDADRLRNGNTLIAVVGTHKVIEVDMNGTVLWNYTAMSGPFDADRLANGNTLISDTYGFRVIEVNPSGTIVWQKTNITMPLSVERLQNGNTLISVWDVYGSEGYVIEINTTGAIQWQYDGIMAFEAKRLANGNTLLADYNGSRVIEITPNGTIVWEVTGIVATSVQRLPNGNTLISSGEDDRVIEVDPSGSVVWEITSMNGPFDADRIPAVEFVVTINKGFGCTVTVENIGTGNATNVAVNISVTGGFVLFGKTKTVLIGDIPSETTKTGRSLPIGFGRIALEATVTCDQGVKGYGNATGFLLLFFII